MSGHQSTLEKSLLKHVFAFPAQDGFKDAQYWDTDEPYHYVRMEQHGEKGPVLLVGGENHKTGIKPDQYEVRGLHSEACFLYRHRVAALSVCSQRWHDTVFWA